MNATLREKFDQQDNGSLLASLSSSIHFDGTNSTMANSAAAAVFAIATASPSTAGAENSAEMAALCEIGSVPLPKGAEWLISAVASFQQMYGELHPYLAAALCIIGTFMNLITVVVLTRKSMISPVNVLLCAVAICDIVVMSSYLVFVWHFLFAAASRCQPADYNYAWAIFTMFHAHASVIFHATSIWLTVSLAQIRVLTIRRATVGPAPNISERFTAILAVATYLIMLLVNLPNFLTFEIMEVPSSFFLSCLKPNTYEDLNYTTIISPETVMSTAAVTEVISKLKGGTTLATSKLLLNTTTVSIDMVLTSSQSPPRFSTTTIFPTTIEDHRIPITPAYFNGDINNKKETDKEMIFTVRAHENDCMKLKLAFWSNGMVFKVVPCFLLTISIVALLNIIADVAHKRKNLAQVLKKKVPKDHTTPMLAAVLSIFLIAELPQGVMLVLTGIFSSETFHKKIYLPLGDFMDLLSLLNSAIGFLIYVGMSRKFRSVFFQLIFSCIRCVLSPAVGRRSIDDGWHNGGGCDDGRQYESQQQWRDDGQTQHVTSRQLQRQRYYEQFERRRRVSSASAWKRSTSKYACNDAITQGSSASKNALLHEHDSIRQPDSTRRDLQWRRASHYDGQRHGYRASDAGLLYCEKQQKQSIDNRTAVTTTTNVAGQHKNSRRRWLHERAIRFLFFGGRRYYEYYKARNWRNAAQRRRTTTITDCTKTEQLSSYYPYSASTLNACAAATVAAAASLGSHLLIYDPFSHAADIETVAGVKAEETNYFINDSNIHLTPKCLRLPEPFNQKKIETLNNMENNALMVPTERRASRILTVPSIPVESLASLDVPPQDNISTIKRISFNLANAITCNSYDNRQMPSSNTTAPNIRHFSNEFNCKVEREHSISSIKLCSPRQTGIMKLRRWYLPHYGIARARMRPAMKTNFMLLKEKNNAIQSDGNMPNSANGSWKRFRNWLLQSPLRPAAPDFQGSVSPRRRFNNLHVESDFIGPIH